MKMKKMLAVLSALTMSASACLSIVPAMAEAIDLSEDELRAIIETYSAGSLAAWEYHDYDGNGTSEAFALFTEEDSEYDNAPIVYFIDSKGTVTPQMSENLDLAYYEGTAKFSEANGKGFFSMDIGGFGSGWDTLLYSVKDGVPYELDISGTDDIQGFYYSPELDVFYTTLNDFSNGFHEYPEYELIYDSSSQQFSIGGRLDSATTPENPEPSEPGKSELDYDTIYYNYVNTLLQEKGRAALDAAFTDDYNFNQVFGIVSSAIYDFGQDGVKELVVVTRENASSNDVLPTDSSCSTVFYLNLYQADASGNVALLDRIRTPEFAFISSGGHDGSIPEMEMKISGNAIYQTICTCDYGYDENTNCYEYIVYDVVDGHFNQYALTTNAVAIYDSTNNVSGDALSEVPLYVAKELLTQYPEANYSTWQYSNLLDLNNEIEKQLTAHQLDFNAVSVSVKKIDGVNYLTLDVDVNSAVDLMYYQYGYNTETKLIYQHINAVMVSDPSAPPADEPATEPSIDYDAIYYNFVYNTLIPEVGRAARNVGAFSTNYNPDKLFGVVSTTIYDFDDDDVDELLVITRDHVYDENEYNGVDYNDGNWKRYTAFHIWLYQADKEGNVNLLDDVYAEDFTVASYADHWYEDAEMGISGNCIYEIYTTNKYSEEGTQSLVHEYNFYEVVDGEFVEYKFSTDINAVWEGGINDALLYADADLSAAYDTYYSGQTYSDSASLSDTLTNYLADVTTLDFNYAEVIKSTDPVMDFINAPEYMALDVDIVPETRVMLMHYQFSDANEDVTYQTMGATMLSTPLIIGEKDDDDDDSLASSVKSKSAPSSASSSSSNSSTNSSSSSESPDTSDKLPVAAGFTALAALAAGFFTRRKNK